MKDKKKEKNDVSRREHLSPDVVVAEREEKRSRYIIAKLACLLAALCVWLYVMNQESVGYERTFTKVPVLLDGASTLNTESDMSVISGYDNTVDVTVSGIKSEVQALSAEDIRVSVDVSTLREAGRHTLAVEVQLPDNILRVGEEELTADVYVDVNDTCQIPVKIVNLDYVISSSYTFGTPILSQELVTVTGPRQILEDIDCAGLSFDLGNVTTSTTMVGTPTLLDAEGVAISNPYIRCEVTEITVEIPVVTKKLVRLVAEYAYPELMKQWAAEITPATISIIGDPILLSSINEIVAYTVGADAQEGEFVIGSVDLPDGVTAITKVDSIYVRLHPSVG